LRSSAERERKEAVLMGEFYRCRLKRGQANTGKDSRHTQTHTDNRHTDTDTDTHRQTDT